MYWCQVWDTHLQVVGQGFQSLLKQHKLLIACQQLVVTGHGKLMLVPIQKLPAFQIAFTVLEEATKAARRDIVNRLAQL